MNLAQVLDGVGLKQPLPDAARSQLVQGLDYDSRRIEHEDIFFAFPGVNVDGRKFAMAAAAQGAVAIVSELPPPPQDAGLTIPWLEVEHGRRALSIASRNLFGDLTGQIEFTGITGTNGKTTTAYLVDAVLRAAGRTTALVGTIEYRLAGVARTAMNTTPESLDFYRLMHELLGQNGKSLTAEVSSHALTLGRVWGFTFHTAVLTNISRDHLDFHQTMEAYFAAKCELFRGQAAPPPKCAVLNRDDDWSARVPLAAETCTYWYGLGADANVRAENVRENFAGLRFDVSAPQGRFAVESKLVGRINVYNLLAACATGLSYGVDPSQIAAGLAACDAVPGRFERVYSGQPFLVVVDYAHTDDALRNVIAVARGMNPKRVLTLFGCGGDRDRAKRPLMGRAAAENSDFVVLTSDNPRSEDPLAIINDALVGLSRFDTPHLLEPDRAKAIRAILEAARPGDIVILAGKGHENYQIFRDKTIHFDDREVARAFLAEMGFGR
ncbi:MAG: UDP-N-acetylmuramoyl-L-alanyl-D-glutamate--2,6-diaminopimelate ligase [Bryobacteraceae bacterium]|nr:UDP-N-acetylmuramoyl-L-alanyl-D-glutamate--2,6-diaminopimelate ligase [Bryobacteraceae bacterium]